MQCDKYLVRSGALLSVLLALGAATLIDDTALIELGRLSCFQVRGGINCFENTNGCFRLATVECDPDYFPEYSNCGWDNTSDPCIGYYTPMNFELCEEHGCVPDGSTGGRVCECVAAVTVMDNTREIPCQCGTEESGCHADWDWNPTTGNVVCFKRWACDEPCSFDQVSGYFCVSSKLFDDTCPTYTLAGASCYTY